MKFSVNRESLLKPLTLVASAVERRQTLPILSNLLLAVSSDNVLSMTGTDLEVELKAHIELDGAAASEGEITVPARKLLDICRSLPEGSDIAVSMDEKGAAISGVDPDRINMITWAISGALGAAGGVFFASYTQLSPSMWVAPVIISIAIVIVGGIGSIMGTLIVAHIIGFLEIAVVALLAPELRGVFTMVLIIGVLIMRPQGLFGREEH